LDGQHAHCRTLRFVAFVARQGLKYIVLKAIYLLTHTYLFL
jgi:hypothetical protein